jgi:hypothetical protein
MYETLGIRCPHCHRDPTPDELRVREAQEKPESMSVDEEMQRRAILSADSEPNHTINPGGNHPASRTSINGLTKGPIDFLAPLAEGICLDDVATGLANCNRFFGQTLWPLSVAEHSMLVLDIFDSMYLDAPLSERQYALCHDAHEAYITDLGSPLKRALETLAQRAAMDAIRAYCEERDAPYFPDAAQGCIDAGIVVELDELMQPVVLEALGVPLPSNETREKVKRADLRARFCEGKVLCPAEAGWDTPDCVLPDGVRCMFGMPYSVARMEFLRACRRLNIY